MRPRQINHIKQINAETWNGCFDGTDPFVRFEFLAALEAHGCATPQTGWTPCHVLLEDDDGDSIIGVAPLYLKTHSYGEFVFDFTWAEESHHLGRPYYPKLVCAVPFTPVTGPRLGARNQEVRNNLANALQRVAESAGVSSLHALFVGPADLSSLDRIGCIERNDVQFHWRNHNYADFSEFLAGLTHNRRKNILRERRRIREAGLRHEWAPGNALSEAQWADVYSLYANTYLERGQSPYLSLGFFLDYGRRNGTPIRLVSVFDGTRRVAVAIGLHSGNTLFGRHWGAADHYHSLHFETCYYQGIEYCIREGLAHFDAGAQGGHKLARGFKPEITRSAHWVSDHALACAIDRTLNRERQLVQMQKAILCEHSAYRDNECGAAAKAAAQH